MVTGHVRADTITAPAVGRHLQNGKIVTNPLTGAIYAARRS
jgi:hypothetical protein